MSVLALAIVAATGCYHATIETGATPSTTEVRKGFASSWIDGLVPPNTASTAAQCPNGVSRVETRLTFVNQLVGILTLGIYTPTEIVVTCAAPGGNAGSDDAESPSVGYDAGSPTGLQQALAIAITRSSKQKRPIYLLPH